MSQSRLTVNVQCQYTADFGKTLKFLQSVDPVTVVACIDNLSAKNRIFELQQALPNAKVIGRYIFPQDGGMHLKPQAEGDTRQYVVSPTDALNAWGDLGKDSRMLYLLNEPQANGATQEDIGRLSAWMLEAIELASERGISVCIGNFGVGHPTLLGNGEYDARFDDVLTALSKNRDTMALGMHVYQPADTFTRLDGLIKRCKTLGITPPRVHITEAGFDAGSGGDTLNGYKSRGYSGTQFAAFQIDKIKNVYAPYFTDDVLQSVATFCWGAEMSWKAFNVETDPDWQAAILTAKDKGLLSIASKVTANYTPDPFEVGRSYKIKTPGAYINLRSSPSISSDIMGQVDDGSVVTVYEETLVSGEYWRRVSYGSVKGWMSMQNGKVTFAPYIPDTTPEPPPVIILLPPAKTYTVTMTEAQYAAWLTFAAAMATVTVNEATSKAA